MDKNKPGNRKNNIPEIVKYYKGLERERTRMLKMKLKNELPMRKVVMKLFQPSKYGSVKKITDYGNTEFVENYLSDWLDKQVIKWKSIPVLRKQMEGLKEYGLEEIKKVAKQTRFIHRKKF